MPENFLALPLILQASRLFPEKLRSFCSFFLCVISFWFLIVMVIFVYRVGQSTDDGSVNAVFRFF